MNDLPRRGPLLRVIAFVAFVSLGLPDGVLGVAWPSVAATFEIPLSRLGVLLTSAMVGYVVSTFSAGSLLGRLGVGRLLAWSSVLMVANSFGYALAPAWSAMVLCGVLAGLGAGAIDAGINAFAAMRFPASMVSWLHASWGVGAMIGPLLMSGTIAADLSWRIGYAVVGVLLAGMAACFFLTLRHWQMAPAGSRTLRAARLTDSLARPAVWLNVALFFLYTGLEVTAGQWSYTLLTYARGVTPAAAAIAVGCYWAALAAGRVAAGAVVARVGSRTLLRSGTAVAPLAAAIVWADFGTAISVLGLMALGFALAPIYPMLITETPRRLGVQHAANGIGFQVCAAYVGAAAVPGAAGIVATTAGVSQIAPFIVATAVILFALHEIVWRRYRLTPLPMRASDELGF